MKLLLKNEESAFAFYESFGDWWVKEGMHLINHNTFGLADALYRFCCERQIIDLKKLAYALKFDLCLHEKPKKQPHCLDILPEEKNYVEFYKQKENLSEYWPQQEKPEGKALARVSHIAEFAETVILFDYTVRDYLGYARYHVLRPTEYQAN